MANKSVFKSTPSMGQKAPPADTTNRAGGKAYSLTDKAALAQYAATGTFNDDFYVKGETMADEVLAILARVEPTFIAKTALYARESGRMKDMPSLLVAHLMSRGKVVTFKNEKTGKTIVDLFVPDKESQNLVKQIFPLVIDNARMLRNVFQMLRSGKTGRKSMGTFPERMLKSWFKNKTPEGIFWQSVGNDPSLGDIIKMVHLDDGGSPERKALHQYLLDKEYDFDSLPPVVKEYEKFKKDPSAWDGALPKAPFEMLMGLPLSDKQWAQLAGQATWTQVRMNLNTFSRHNVFKSESAIKYLAEKLGDREEIAKAKPFPYQLFTTYLNTSEHGEEAIPRKVRDALHKAVDVAVDVLPFHEGPSHALIDVSGSMGAAVTGARKGATSKATRVQVAAMIGSMFLRKNKESSIIAFSDNAIENHGCSAHDSVMTNAERLSRLGGGGTNLSSAFQLLNKRKAKGDLVIVASDLETWADTPRHGGYAWGAEATVPHQEWNAYKARNPKAKLVCINLAASGTCQVANNKDVLNIGGFSDAMWDVIRSFVEGTPSADHWVNTIEAIQLPEKV